MNPTSSCELFPACFITSSRDLSFHATSHHRIEPEASLESLSLPLLQLPLFFPIAVRRLVVPPENNFPVYGRARLRSFPSNGSSQPFFLFPPLLTPAHSVDSDRTPPPPPLPFAPFRDNYSFLFPFPIISFCYVFHRHISRGSDCLRWLFSGPAANPSHETPHRLPYYFFFLEDAFCFPFFPGISDLAALLTLFGRVRRSPFYGLRVAAFHIRIPLFAIHPSRPIPYSPPFSVS